MVIADSDPYSLHILKCFQLKGIIPIIRSRRNVKTHRVRELKKVYFFKTDFIPKEWSDDYFLKIYSLRPMIEQGNSFFLRPSSLINRLIFSLKALASWDL